MHIHYASSPNKIVEFTRTILSATPPKTHRHRSGIYQSEGFYSFSLVGSVDVNGKLAYYITSARHTQQPQVAKPSPIQKIAVSPQTHF